MDEFFSEAGRAEPVELGRARPFSVLQKRLGRKKVSEKMLQEIPVAYLVFDVLYADGELLIDRPLAGAGTDSDELLAAERNAIHHRTLRLSSGKVGMQGNLMFEETAVRTRRDFRT